MFEGKTVWQIINMGGFTMYLLIFLSIVSLTIFFERLYYFATRSIDRVEFMDRIRAEIKKCAYDVAIKICEMEAKPITSVVCAGLKKHGHDGKDVMAAMEREVLVETVKLERYVSIVGVIGNVAVYIGLFGTVLGIVNAFHNIASEATGGLGVVMAGVAEALICTATGLLVAVPAVVAYNYFVRRVDAFVVDMEYCSSELNDLMIAEDATKCSSSG
jgi:biopolymer transport protein ExbB/TolQ